MEETQKQKLDPRIKNVWRVSDTIALTLIFLCVFAVGGIALLVDESTSWWAGPYCLISFVCFVALLILFWVVITPLRYIRWSYALSKEFLDIMRGIIVRKHTVVPFIRVQNTDTRQGPLLRMMGLASVTISTAAGSMEIPGLLPNSLALPKRMCSAWNLPILLHRTKHPSRPHLRARRWPCLLPSPHLRPRLLQHQ